MPKQIDCILKREIGVIKKLAILMAAGLLVSVGTQALTDEERNAIEERIQPVGEVCLEGDDSCGGAAVVVSSGPRSGKAVYDAVCMACHATGAAGAPKSGDSAAWAPRIAKGIDVLYSSGINGLAGTGMIAKGGCGSCSDEEVQAAVDYMVESSQ